jgi:tetratricopeptide (TPR) repeat protein
LSSEGTPTPAEEAALARELLARGDLTHGVSHLAGALAADPTNPEWLELLDRAIAESDEPLELAPLEEGKEGSWFGIVAVRAYVLAKTGRVVEGVELLLQVFQVRPDVPYLEWAVGWLDGEPGAGPRVDRKHLLSFFGSALTEFPGTVIEEKAARAVLDRLARLADRTVGDPDEEPMLSFSRAAVLRKLGRLDEALGIASRAYARYSGYYLASAQAQIHKARRDDQAWNHWQQEAIRHDPDNVATRLELGDYEFDAGRTGNAVRWYAEALKRDPEDSWAAPSYYAALWHQGKSEGLAKLHEYATGHPDNERAAALLRAGAPFEGHLPPPEEATLGILGHIAEKARKSEPLPVGDMKITLSALEAPSSRLAGRLGLEALCVSARMIFLISSIQEPDPRLPRRAVRHQVWRYAEERKFFGKKLTTEPVAAVPAPPEALAQAIARIAVGEFNRSAWLAAAEDMVRRLRPDVLDLLGVMAEPPFPPPEQDASIWLLKVQMAAGLAVARFDPETPWPRSLRREVLFDLANGPMDWTVDAAIVALTALAQIEPEIVPDVTGLFLDLLEHQPRPGHLCYEQALIRCFPQLPGLPGELRASIDRYREAWESHR